LKRLLIISPYFPPSNAADMQRIRMSLPYFRQNGWQADVVVVDEQYSEMVKDDLLLQSIPADVKVYKVDAFSKKITGKLGLGNLALRSMWYYRKTVNKLLKEQKYDLIYFSTTQFQIMVLGAYWKRKFNVPYVIDMQDPWHSDYYKNKPKSEQPAKYWFSYRLNKCLEPVALKKVDGLISVSEGYITTLKERYPQIKDVPSATIPFGAFDLDLKIANDNEPRFKSLLQPGFKNIVYVGRGGTDMHQALSVTFKALKKCIDSDPDHFKNIRLYFIGTSYAPTGQGKQTILPLAQQYGLAGYVIEQTDRISYYHTLNTLQHADALFIPGSDDPSYTASKIYPYLLTNKPLLVLFNVQSPALDVLKEYEAPFAYSYGDEMVEDKICAFFFAIADGTITSVKYNAIALQKYSAQSMTVQQCALFNSVLNQ
jgi:hypothetical protein